MNNETTQITIKVNEDISLTEIRSDDRDSFVRYLNDKEIFDNTLRIPSPYSDKDAESFLQFVRQSNARHGHPVHFAVRDNQDNLIGGFGFDGLIIGHRAEIGYWLAKTYWGQGIMTAVVQSACAFAMGKWNLVRITAHVFVSNERSARVLEKCGFQFEGVLRKHHMKDGKHIDSKLYALVKCDQTPTSTSPHSEPLR